MAGLNLPIVGTSCSVQVATDPLHIQIDEDVHRRTASQLASLSEQVWPLRGFGLAGILLIGVLALVVFPSPSHAESPSGSALAWRPAPILAGVLPAEFQRGAIRREFKRGVYTQKLQIFRQVNRKTPPVMQMSSPMKGSRSWESHSSSAVDPNAFIPAVPEIEGRRQDDRNPPSVVQMSSPTDRTRTQDTYNYPAVDPSEAAEALKTGVVSDSISNRIQPGDVVLGGDFGFSSSILGWLSILAVGTGGAAFASRAAAAQPRVGGPLKAVANSQVDGGGAPARRFELKWAACWDGVRPLQRLHRFAAVAFLYVANQSIKSLGLTVLPSALVGMISLFAFLLLLEQSGRSTSAASIFHILEPGYRFLLKWAPLFFLPSLVKLPGLQESFSPSVLLCLGLLLCGGFFVQVVVTAAIADLFRPQGVERLESPAQELMPGQIEPMTEVSADPQASAETYPRPELPFERRWLLLYAAVMALCPICFHAGWVPQAAENVFMVGASLFFLVAGSSLPLRVRSFVHPVVITLLGSWAAVWLWASQSAHTVGFLDVLASYSTGAGAYLAMLLEPLVVALALLLYERRDVLWRNLPAILTTTFAAALSGLFSTALLARMLGLPGVLATASVSRFLTAPLALEVSSALGASQPLALAMTTCTGLLGAIFGQAVLTCLRIKRAPAQGLALGATAHVFGTVSLMSWAPKAVPYAAVSFVLVGSMSVILTSLPPVKAALLYILL